MKTKAIVSAVLTAAMTLSVIPFSASAEIMTEEEMRTTIEELAEENPDLDFSGLLNIKPPPGYEDMEPNPGILEAFAVYQVDDNIASFLEKHIATDKAGQLLNELYLKSWNEEMRNTYGDDYAETITKIKYLPIFMGVVKLDNGEYHPCELRKHWMGYEQVLFITGTIDPSYWQEEEINEDILTVEDYNKFSYEEAIIYALEYYNEHGEFLVGLGEAESGGLTITPDWNEEKVEETVLGDANCDGNVNMADAVLIMQSLANPDKYGVNGTDETHITAQGEKNGDMDGNGLTNADALAIQKELLKIDTDRIDDTPSFLIQTSTFNTLEEFEKNEKNIKYYYIPSVNSDEYKLSKVTKRDNEYVMTEYRMVNPVVADGLSEYDTERLQTLICRYSLNPNGAELLNNSFIENGYTAVECDGKTYYRLDEHAENNPDKQITGYETAFLQDGQLIYMHLPAVDTFENMIAFAELQKIEIK